MMEKADEDFKKNFDKAVGLSIKGLQKAAEDYNKVFPGIKLDGPFWDRVKDPLGDASFEQSNNIVIPDYGSSAVDHVQSFGWLMSDKNQDQRLS